VIGDGKEVGELAKSHAGVEEGLIANLVEAAEDGSDPHHALRHGERLLDDLHPINLILVVKALHFLELFFRMREVCAGWAERPTHLEKDLDAIGGWRT
jgi:hypothetical protein